MLQRHCSAPLLIITSHDSKQQAAQVPRQTPLSLVILMHMLAAGCLQTMNGAVGSASIPSCACALCHALLVATSSHIAFSWTPVNTTAQHTLRMICTSGSLQKSATMHPEAVSKLPSDMYAVPVLLFCRLPARLCPQAWPLSASLDLPSNAAGLHDRWWVTGGQNLAMHALQPVPLFCIMHKLCCQGSLRLLHALQTTAES